MIDLSSIFIQTSQVKPNIQKYIKSQLGNDLDGWHFQKKKLICIEELTKAVLIDPKATPLFEWTEHYLIYMIY